MEVDDGASLESGVSSTLDNNDGNIDFHGGYAGSSTKDETLSNSEKSGDGSASVVVAGHETRMVRRSKVFLWLVLVLAATGAAIATYRFLKKEDDFAVSKEVCCTIEGSVLIEKQRQPSTLVPFFLLFVGLKVRAQSSRSFGHFYSERVAHLRTIRS